MHLYVVYIVLDASIFAPPKNVYNHYVGKSIYVAIPCLGYDTELESTINSCLEYSSKENDIKIGVALIGNKELYSLISKKYKNIKVSYMDVKDCFGIGNSRIFAASMYDNEDYFLQIDSHTLFSNDWDKTLIDTFTKAKEYVENDLTVISAPLGQYWYKDNDYVYEKDILGYFKWIPGEFWVDSIPKFTDINPYFISDKLFDTIKNNGFAPALKISAHFIFGDSNFANNLSIDKNIIFWEEEILQSLELINNGFTIVYPGIETPMFHFPFIKSDQNHYREEFDVCFKDLNITLDSHQSLMTKNYLDFMNNPNNIEKIKKYQEYAEIDLINGPSTFVSYPKKFANSNKMI